MSECNVWFVLRTHPGRGQDIPAAYFSEADARRNVGKWIDGDGVTVALLMAPVDKGSAN